MRFFARRLFLVGALLAALAMLMTPALASADDDDDDGGGGGDRAFCAPAGPPEVGQCSYFSGDVRFDFDASSGPNGENPMGTFRQTSSFGFVVVEITCLRVSGNTASLGGRVTDSGGLVPPAVGTGRGVSVVDNGPPPADQISVATTLPEAPAADSPNCGSFNSSFLIPVTEGDIVVQDNTAGGGGDDEDEDDDDEDDDDDDGDDDD